MISVRNLESGRISTSYMGDNQTVIWRYMDFWKFASLLEHKALYFHRTDLLEDKWEGCLPSAKEDAIRKLGGNVLSYFENLRKTFVSCWHMNEAENYAMWGMYSTGVQGIAIKTTVSRVFRALPYQEHVIHNMPDEMSDRITIERMCLFSGVQYCDFSDALATNSGRFFKRKPYEYEHEIRLFAFAKKDQDPSETGFYAPCDLSTLIEEVVLAPGTMQRSELRSFTEKCLASYGLDSVRVRYSGLDADPPKPME